MTRASRRGAVVAVWLALAGGAARGQERRAVNVEPGELVKRPDLVGSEIVVDDRVALFQFHRDRGFDQIFLKRCPEVSFDLPATLATAKSPQAPAVRIHGVLRQEGGRWHCDVSKVDLLPSDADRLTRGLAVTPKSDVEGRLAWARWAERRAKAFDDKALMRQAREVEGEAIRAEEGKPRGEPSAFWLGLAERARQGGLAEPEPGALAHRGFRAAFKGLKTAEDHDRLRARVEGFFPKARNPLSQPIDISRWEQAYSRGPSDAYRAAPEEVRAALDRALWADLAQKGLEARGAAEPRSALALATEAAALLPDRPAVAESFLQAGLQAAGRDVGALRQPEVEALAALYRDRLRQPNRAQGLYRAWLDEQRKNRLSPRDADGRLALAQQYEALVGDRRVALELLREAWTIDPTSREVAEAFLNRGFKKVDGAWVEGAKGRVATQASAPEEKGDGGRGSEGAVTVAAAKTDSLRNATPEEVRARMSGGPNRRSWSVSRGGRVEQWVYAGPREDFYINLRQKPGESRPRVVAFYALPKLRSGGGASP